MTLPEYLQSEQARSEMQQAIEHGVADAPGRMLSTGTTGAWSVVQVTVDGVSVTAYHRPDGDRYIVTDLGEGVRALRLRTGALGVSQRQLSEVLNGIPTFGVIAVGDALYKAEVKPAMLPDALCRVMLASLRVAEVTPRPKPNAKIGATARVRMHTPTIKVQGAEFERGQKWTDGTRTVELAFQVTRGRWETVGGAGQKRTTLSEQTLRGKWRRV